MNLSTKYEIDKEEYYKSKKYVIKIFPENITKIDSLDIKERDQFVNEAISSYVNQYDCYKKQTLFVEKLKKSIFQIIYIIIFLALLGAVGRFLSVYSDSNNKLMQNNFERLYDNYNLR